MSPLFLSLNLLLTVAVCAVNFLLYIPRGALRLKALASGGFLLMGAVNLLHALVVRSGQPYAAVMAAGLALALLGDITLDGSFPLGAGLFAAGHICYILAQCLLLPLTWADGLLSILLFAASGGMLLFWPRLRFPQIMTRAVCVVYALIISLMAGKALSGCLTHFSSSTALIALGSALFFASDLMLVLNCFAVPKMKTGALCLALYYPAQCLLAFSAFWIACFPLR